MKLFHLSDLHIGIRLHNRDLSGDQTFIFRQIADYASAEQPDAILIAGDIYDKAVPSAESVELFDRFLTDLRTAAPDSVIMMISGNHDSAPRINCYRSVLAGQRVHMIGQPPQTPEEHIERIRLYDSCGPVDFWLLPFVKPSMVKRIVGTNEDGSQRSYSDSVRLLLEREEIDRSVRNVLVSHQFYLPAGSRADMIERMESEAVTAGNIDAVSGDVLQPFDYAALGHIHKPMKAGSEQWRYCGTPLPYSVSEAGQAKGILAVQLMEKGRVQIRTLPLTPMRQVLIIRGTLQEVLPQACDDYVSILLTDRVDLDVCDMQDRLRQAFPNLLEIRREQQRRPDYTVQLPQQEQLDPFALCLSFLGDIDEEEQALLRDIIESVQQACP